MRHKQDVHHHLSPVPLIYCSYPVCACVSGLLHPGDLLVEVNGNPVGGLEPEQVIQILVGHLTDVSVDEVI